MARVIEARALITAEDQASKKIADMAKRVSEISKAQTAYTKSGGAQFAAMAKEISATQAKLDGLTGYRKLAKDLNAASLSHRRAQQDANQLKIALDAAGGAGGRLAKDYDRAARAADRARSAFMAQGRATREAQSGLEGMGIPVRRLAEMERNLKQQIDAASASLERQAKLVQNTKPWGAAPTSKSGVPLIPRMAPAMMPADAPRVPLTSVMRPSPASPSAAPHRPGYDVPVAEVGGLLGFYKGLRDAVFAGMDVDTERSQARQSGWTDGEISRGEIRANELAARYGMSPGAAFNMLRESRPTFGGDLDTTLRNSEPFFGVATAMRQKSPRAGDSEINKAVNDMIKAGEILGYSNDPLQLIKYADLMTRMAQVFGTQLRGEEVLNFAKRSKTAGSDVSFEFLQDVLPTLLPELGGDLVGSALMTLRQAMVGGKMKKRAAENMAKLDLIDQKDMIKTLDDDVVGVQPNAVKGADLVRRNPKKWVEQYLIPAMDAKNVAPEDRAAIISTLYSDRNAESMVNLLVTQAARMKKDKDLVDQAKGIKGVPLALKDDPYLVSKRFGAGASNVGAALIDPFLDPLKAAGGAAADALNAIAEAARVHPTDTGVGTAGGAAVGGLLGWMNAGRFGALGRIAGLGVGAGAGGILGGAASAYAASWIADSLRGAGRIAGGQHWLPKTGEDIDSLKARIGAIDAEVSGIESRLHPSRRNEPNPDLDRLRTERRDALNRIEVGSRLPDNSLLKSLELATSKLTAIDITGKLEPVELKGQATVAVTVKVDGPGHVGGMATSSSGHVRAEGTALVGRFGRN